MIQARTIFAVQHGDWRRSVAALLGRFLPKLRAARKGGLFSWCAPYAGAVASTIPKQRAACGAKVVVKHVRVEGCVYSDAFSAAGSLIIACSIAEPLSRAGTTRAGAEVRQQPHR
jgi:hypothetical protein